MEPPSLQKGVELFNRGEFFESHEVLEALWVRSVEPERWFLQSLIHFAVALHHHQRGNNVGAARQLAKCLRKIQAYLPEWGGLRTDLIEQNARRCFAMIEDGAKIDPYPQIHPSR
jgi:predicted metal-dependent hydrolase